MLLLKPHALIASLIVAVLPAGCGPAPEAQSPPSESSPPESASPAAAEPAASAEPVASAEPAAGGAPSEAKPSAPSEAAAESSSEALARDFLKSGGRRIGYSATKKGFAYPVERRAEAGFGLDVQFVGEDGNPRDTVRVCQIGECEEGLNEIVKELLPKLASRIEQEGYVSIRGIGWPQGRDELEVSSLSMKLKYKKGRMEALREGKPAAALTPVGKRLDAETVLAVFVVPDSKILGVLAPPAKPGKDAKGQIQELYILKLP